jgi:adenylyltransferase/sulfurtransferase
LVPSCAEGGVLGVLPGVVGALQAAEALKLLLGAGDPLVGRLLVVDALAMRFLPVAVARRADCPACGDAARAAGFPAIRDALPGDAAAACAPAQVTAAQVTAAEVTAAELAALLAGPRAPQVVDVREAHEWAAGHLAGARHAPLAALDAALDSAAVDPRAPVVTVCASGVRSARAAERLRARGAADVRSLAGGLAAWRAAGGDLVAD